MTQLTHEYVVEHLAYDENTGEFAWKIPGRGRQMGKILGSPHGTGYTSIRLQGELYFTHRLAWFYIYGKWPDNYVDHIDGNKTNNSRVNLRDVSQTLNNQNIQKAQKNSKTGLLGVREHKGRFQANIGVDSRSKYLGTYDTAEEAAQAYAKAKETLHTGAVNVL